VKQKYYYIVGIHG